MPTDLHIPHKVPQTISTSNALKKIPVSISVWFLMDIPGVRLCLSQIAFYCALLILPYLVHIMSMYSLGIIDRQCLPIVVICCNWNDSEISIDDRCCYFQ